MAGIDDALIAINWRDARAYGCPYCGYRSSASNISCNGAVQCQCGECRKIFVVLCDELGESPITIGNERPKLRDHPRVGIPAHGRPDVHPEYFNSRGIGTDSTPGCFICGGINKLRANISAFVQCKAAGERVVAMFDRGARLDYRENEPDYIQVKIGSCEEHKATLKYLSDLTHQCLGIISAEMVKNVSKGMRLEEGVWKNGTM